MPSVLTLALPGWIAAVAVMALLWACHLRLKNVALAGVGGIALVGGLSVFYAIRAVDGMPGRRVAMGAMVGSWAARLAVMLLYDRVLKRAVDDRYAGLQAFWFFQLLALAAILFSLPALLTVRNPAENFSTIELAAAALWATAFAGESTADRQLLYFKLVPENRGRTCRAGLWRYSRHPNYFFEWLIWVALALFASASPNGWIAFVCPAVMLFALLRVTGIPSNEAQALRTRADYPDYQRATSAFIPWFPGSSPPATAEESRDPA